MKLLEARRQASRLLASHYIPDPSLEAEVLLRHGLGVGRSGLWIQGERELTPREERAFWGLIGRRLVREPSAYIRGRREFWGREFYVDHRALIPRPESELLVEKALELLSSSPPPFTVADVGTGSGAIAISLALGLHQARVYAIDISPEALEVARINCARHKVVGRVHLLCGDMLAPLPHPVNLVVANLPYIKDEDLEGLQPEVRCFEPLLALAGGGDGLDKVRAFLSQVGSYLLPSGSFLLEVGQGQGEKVRELVKGHFPQARVELIPDLALIPRVLLATLSDNNFSQEASHERDGRLCQAGA